MGKLEQRRGLTSAVIAYAFWGLFPLYWPLLKPSSTGEILANRILWSLIFVFTALTLRRSWLRAFRLARSLQTLAFLTLAALSIAVNWGVYIYTVNIGRTVDASLGYFIMPLLSVLVGVGFFGERLRWMQWVAVGVAALGIILQAILIGRTPWLSLVLALSFGGYGILKKMADVSALEGMLLETAILAGPALVLIFFLVGSGDATFGRVSVLHTVLMVLGGLITVVPLIMLSSASVTIPLTTLGNVQYLTPVVQFLIGWLIQDESITAGRWTGFALVWLSLGVLSIDSARVRASSRRKVTPAEIATPS